MATARSKSDDTADPRPTLDTGPLARESRNRACAESDGKPLADLLKSSGFRSSFTAVPNEFIDWLLSELNPSASVVFLYLLRRTFGHRENADAVSLDQICAGIVRNSLRYDCGTGLTRPTVIKALRELRSIGLVEAKGSEGSGRGAMTTYRIVLTGRASEIVPNGSRWAARWNELVPERSVNPSHFCDTAIGVQLCTRFDGVCQKAREVIRAGGKVTFAGMLKIDSGTNMYGWQRLLAGEFDWLLRKNGSGV
jgi:hypothetical protein